MDLLVTDDVCFTQMLAFCWFTLNYCLCTIWKQIMPLI